VLGYQFMQRALLAGAALAVTLPLIGVTLVLRRTSMTGDALAHCSLAGVAGGLVAGIDPGGGSPRGLRHRLALDGGDAQEDASQCRPDDCHRVGRGSGACGHPLVVCR